MPRPTLDELKARLGGIDLHDDAVRFARKEARRKLDPKRALFKMQAKHGPPPATSLMEAMRGVFVSCGSCAHLQKVSGNVSTYYKCALYSLSRSEASDFRKSWPGCGAWKEK